MENQPEKVPVPKMRQELARVCNRVEKRNCRTPYCPLYELCLIFGNPNLKTTKAEYIRAMYMVYMARKRK